MKPLFKPNNDFLKHRIWCSIEHNIMIVCNFSYFFLIWQSQKTISLIFFLNNYFAEKFRQSSKHLLTENIFYIKKTVILKNYLNLLRQLRKCTIRHRIRVQQSPMTAQICRDNKYILPAKMEKILDPICLHRRQL